MIQLIAFCVFVDNPGPFTNRVYAPQVGSGVNGWIGGVRDGNFRDACG